MNRREQLQERYEDALFELLMDDVFEMEGETLLQECERLNADPDAAIPEELDRKCRRLIRSSRRKERARSVGRLTARVLKKAAVAAAIAALLMGIAYAAIPEFRVGILNIILKLTEAEQSTRMQFTTEEELKAGKTHAGFFDYTLPEIPDKYELAYAMEDDTGCYFSYENGKDMIIVDISCNGEGGISNVDTENAQSVTNIKVNEYDGICVIKDGFVHVTWGDTDHLVFLSVMSNCLDEEKVLALAEATKIL